MNVSIQHLVKAVIDSLEDEVLPHLDPQTKPASNVRASLMLLANIEARVTHEARCLFDDNRELRDLLQDAAANTGKLNLDDELRGALLATLELYPRQESWFDANAAALENRDYQELLSQVIEHLPPGVGDKTEFRHKLRRYLAETDKRELLFVEKALARVPL